MSFAVNRVQKFAPSPDLPQSATVYDFACLFTHDLKRKAKRWQDGKLKYHTFNKKVVVYDDRGHFVGDAHWDGEEAVVEGDELELDRGGVMVQVADCKGHREQDLTEVLDKRAREVAKRREQAAAKAPKQKAAPGQHATPAMSSSSAAAAAPRRPPPPHLPLNGLLQSPGPIGRASIPDKSPYEARRQVLSHVGEPRETPRKEGASTSSKRKLSPSPPSKAGFAQSLFGTRLNLSATPSAELLAARARALRERTNLQQRRLEEEEEEEQELQPPPKRPAVKASVLKTLSDSTLRAIGATREPPPPRIIQLEDDSDGPSPQEEDTSPYFEANAAVPRATTSRHSEKENEDAGLFVQSPVRREAPAKKPLQDAAKRKRTSRPQEETLGNTPAVNSSSPCHSPQPSSPIRHAHRSNARPRSPTHRKPAKKAEIEERDDESVRRQPKQKERRSVTQKTQKKSRVEESVETVPPKQKEQRTELRIRSRKRRGLLMMTEQLPVAVSRESPDLSHSPVETPNMSPERIASPVRETVEPVTIESSPVREVTEVEVSSTPMPEETAHEKPADSRTQQIKDTEMTEVSVPSTAPESDVDMVTVAMETAESPKREQTPAASESVTVFKNESPENHDMVVEVETIASPKSEAESLDTSPQQKWTLRRKPAKKYTVDSEEDEEADKDDQVAQLQIDSADGGDTSNDTQGPRLMKMARRGVKSREIFGFVPSNAPVAVPMQFAMATAQLGNWNTPKGKSDTLAAEKASEPDGSDELEKTKEQTTNDAAPFLLKPPTEAGEPKQADGDALARPKHQTNQDVPAGCILQPQPTLQELVDGHDQAEEEASGETTIDKATSKMPAFRPPKLTTQHSGASHASDSSSRPRIVNPATRGKKAARREHAAGQAPQCVVPFEPAMAVMGRIAVKPQTLPTAKATTNLPAVLPGFSNASGGAWSRHAEDLLGMTRPRR